MSNQILTEALDREACSIGETFTAHLRARAKAMYSETHLAEAIELAKASGSKVDYCQIRLNPPVFKKPRVKK